MVGEIVHGGLGDRPDHREVKDDAQDHHHQVEHGEGDRPAGLKSFCLELVLEIGHFWCYDRMYYLKGRLYVKLILFYRAPHLCHYFTMTN